MSSMVTDEEKKKKEGLQIAATFISGIAFFQIFHVAFSSSKFTLLRFRIPPSHMSVYVNRMVISYRISTFCGVLLSTICDLASSKRSDLIHRCLFSMFFGCHILLLCTYHTGGEQGHLTLFYWIIAISAFFVGSSYIMAVRIVAGNIRYLLVGLPMSRILMFFYQLSFLFIWEVFGLSNAHFWLVQWQIIFATFLCVLTACLWIPAYEIGGDCASQPGGVSNGGESPETGPKDAGWKDFGETLIKATSPFLMSILGYGTQNVFYPGISPYKLVGIDKGSKIVMANMFISSIASFTILGLASSNKGPNRPWNGGNQAWLWHGAWGFFGIQMFCGILFLHAMHYPMSSISRMIRDSAWTLGFLTVLYNSCVELTYGIGTNGSAKQGGNAISKVNTMRLFILVAMQISSASLGDGYVKIYSQYSKDPSNWPTKHFTTKKAFWFWTWNATKVAFGRLKCAFSTDLRSEVIGKKGHLFIVYEDEMDNSSKPTKAKDPKVMKIVHDI
ncbi:conserved hypothetical protein [Theileria equi strain WA]|uniref:Uncharacterized protein n=1 Tax=Theileria equi strain WA TaxID=1537102 RepID=L1LCH2_THEEQ|nr:conserved hypothetical protein [Theileria equi strain WA]EKX73041.1 conserved hypothetical protein [Theileria equi strain WA]|eukprot:XP_004832493.1 conserved hypothetical protein [Theileria equi strain WA]